MGQCSPHRGFYGVTTMVYSPRHIFVAYLFSAIIGVQHIGTALGQGAKTPKVVDPPLFLVYALEDLYKATLPNDAELFEGFVVRQQLQYDQLMLYISKQKKRDEELVGHFDGYRKVLEKVRDLAKEVEVCQKKHLAAFAKAKLKLQYEEMRQANAVLFSGLSQGFYAMSQGGSDEQAVRQGLSAAMLRAIDAQYQLDAARSEARSSFEKTMREFKAELNSFFPRKLSDLQKQLGAGPALSKELLERNGWPSETDFSAGREPVDWGEGDRPANPFWIERVILKRKPPEGIKAV